MKRRNQNPELDQARRISEFVDSLVVQHRVSGDSSDVQTHADGSEFRELSRLATLLSGIRVVPSEGASDDVVSRLIKQRFEAAAGSRLGPRRGRRIALTAWRWLGSSPFRMLKSAGATVAALTILLLVLDVLPLPSASAAGILTRADAALVSLAPPGKLLFRRWRIIDHIRDRPEAVERIEERYTFEWIDGSDRRRAMGRSYLATGPMYAAYVNALDHDQYVRRIYLAPGLSALGVSNEPRGLLSIIPSAAEFEAAAARFNGADRAVLETYLARGYMYQPLISERRFNDAMLKEITGPAPLPRVRLSLDDSELLGDRPVHKVRSVDAVRVQFRWRSSGPTAVWLERQETVRYISKDTYLTVKSEEKNEDETGRTITTTRELVQTAIVDEFAGGSSPFDLQVPENVPVRRQSAYEHLSQVIQALNRAPAFLSKRH
jgi:hypothetical protein